ncbi:MAG: DUF933 domain-containing protein, partial [Atribacterota bacterium]
GLPLTGKTTIFSLLSGILYDGSFKMEVEERTTWVRDDRLDTLARIYEPERTVYTTLVFIDIPSFDPVMDKKDKGKILQMIQNVDALLFVIRAFENEQVPFPSGGKTPSAQLETLRTELIIRDLEVAENRLERLVLQRRKKKPTPEDEKEEILLGQIRKELDEGNFTSRCQLHEDERRLLGSMAFFTLKPVIVGINVDERQMNQDDFPGKDAILDECHKQNFASMIISGKIESELVELSDDEKKEFMEELGIEKPGIERLTQVVYDHVGYLSFFTVGKDEVRAWTIERGTSMKRAAGKIHTDLEKGFIRAEVMKYDDFVRLGSEEKLKQAGLWKLVGKDEVVEDGDILTIRHSL